jgi:hypothetical protein
LQRFGLQKFQPIRARPRKNAETGALRNNSIDFFLNMLYTYFQTNAEQTGAFFSAVQDERRYAGRASEE